MNWTKEQDHVIKNRGENLLVNASAGSGKTAVTIERFFSMIKEPLIHADEILLVTFTKAAAAEMRERLRTRIEAAIRNGEGDPQHLRRQELLLHRSQITTIDSFCAYLIRNYVNETELEPGFRVMEELEAKLMRRDLLREMLRNWHASSDPDFRERFVRFAEPFSTGRDESGLEELILESFLAAESHPDPAEFLQKAREASERGAVLALIAERAKGLIREGEERCREAQAHLTDGMTDTTKTGVAAYTELFTLLAKKNDATDMNEELIRFQKPGIRYRRGTLSEEEEAAEKKVKAALNRLNAIRTELNDECFPYAERIARTFDALEEENCRILIDLTGEFQTAYRAEKRKRNLVDFSDLEHEALAILRKDGERTKVAKEMASRFCAVMIDEYQDSNELQEAILTAVSRIEDGEPNYYCVGDVKQSIYRFRQADPKLFLRKLRSYEDRTQGVRIDLQENYRSSGGILTFVNAVFRKLMQKDAGGVEYDRAAHLVAGRSVRAVCDEDGREVPVEALITLYDRDSSFGQEHSKRESEAFAVADRILALTEKGTIHDEKNDVTRPIRFGDIVILLRSLGDSSQLLYQVLEEKGIPAQIISRSGYFQTLEVQTVLAFLSVIDNPRQDIPFAAAFRAAEDLSADDLARIRLAYPDPDKDGPAAFADLVRSYVQNGDDPDLKEKAAHFLSMIDRFRRMEPDLPLRDLIALILTESGYGDHLRALPGGRQRLANIRMLLDRASDFEKTSYRGVFHFIRYIEQLKKAKEDVGEVADSGRTEDVVRILTIHASKGLQYPIVILPQLDAGLNQRDLNGNFLVHPKYGYASKVIDQKTYTRALTQKYLWIRRSLLTEEIGEELRVLYVAMTRAQQMLILSAASDPGAEKTRGEYRNILPPGDEPVPVSYLTEQRSFWKWVGPILLQMEEEEDPACVISYAAPEEGSKEERRITKQHKEILAELTRGEEDAGIRRELDERFLWTYPYEDRASIPVKLSVSELKRAEAPDEESLSPYTERDVIPLVPEFIGEKDRRIEGASRGTVYHTFLMRLDFRKDPKQQLREMVGNGFLTEEEAASIDSGDIQTFLAGPLSERMAKADEAGLLIRERPFTMMVDASKVDPAWPKEEEILTQGIVDACFEEDGEMVVVDYKTDRGVTAEELKERYRMQLDLYAEAIGRATGKRVREKLLYSFSLHAIIPV